MDKFNLFLQNELVEQLAEMENPLYRETYWGLFNEPIDHGHYENVYQFKIVLQDVKPNIWRRILVPENFDFRELHLAINHAMGWFNTHLHLFKIKNPNTGEKEIIGKLEEEYVPDDCCTDIFKPATISETNTKISDYFKIPNYKFTYEYDFGDEWVHVVVFEKILPREPDTEYPKCLDGKRQCPPEKCGGPEGYMKMLKILSTPSHPQYKDCRQVLANNFGDDPDNLDPKQFKNDVTFFDSDKQKELSHGTKMCHKQNMNLGNIERCCIM